MIERDALAAAMQRWGFLEDPAPPAALAWIDTFLKAYGAQIATLDDALPFIAELRAEACTVPALDLERLRSRQVLFFLDTIGQYVDAQPELRGLPLAHDLPEMAREFGISPQDAAYAVCMALTGKTQGPPLELLFPLLGHDRIMIRIGAVNSMLLHGRGLEPIKFGPGGAPFEPIQGKRPEEAGEE
jgi:Anticodon binding domain